MGHEPRLLVVVHGLTLGITSQLMLWASKGFNGHPGHCRQGICVYIHIYIYIHNDVQATLTWKMNNVEGSKVRCCCCRCCCCCWWMYIAIKMELQHVQSLCAVFHQHTPQTGPSINCLVRLPCTFPAGRCVNVCMFVCTYMCMHVCKRVGRRLRQEECRFGPWDMESQTGFIGRRVGEYVLGEWLCVVGSGRVCLGVVGCVWEGSGVFGCGWVCLGARLFELQAGWRCLFGHRSGHSIKRTSEFAALPCSQ